MRFATMQESHCRHTRHNLLLVLALFICSLRGGHASGQEQFDYCVIGAGPAGLQMAFFLQEAGRSHVVFEKGRPGQFFRRYPRHRNLISINKRHTGRGGDSLSLEHNLRHDWHSLLTGVNSGEVHEEILFGQLTDDFYPKADKLVEYAEKWVEYWGLDIRTKSDVTVVRENHEGDHKFTLEVVTTGNDDQEAISETRCKWVLAGTGFWQGHTPDIDGMKENSIHYNDMPSEMAPYSNKTIAIIGAGNAGFETFKAVMGEAAYVHLHSPSPLKLAWETHYVGHLRSVNVIPIDNYQLKSQDLLMIPSREIGTGRDDTIVEKEWIDGKEKSCLNSKNGRKLARMVASGNVPSDLSGKRTDGHSLTFEERVITADRMCYDMIILCTGMKVDKDIFQLNKALKTKGGRKSEKYPALSEEYESVSAEGLYFMGTLAHVRDHQKSSGGFVHGFRYTVRALHKLLEQKNHGVEWPRFQVALNEEEDGPDGTLLKMLGDRMDTASGLYQMFAAFCDLVLLPRTRGPGANAVYLEEVPVDLIPQFVAAGQEYITLTMEYGPDFHGHERVLRSNRVFHNFDPAQAHRSQFLHPIVRYYAPQAVECPTAGSKMGCPKETAALHILESIYTDFKDPTLHTAPLKNFLARFEAEPLPRGDPPLNTRWPDAGGNDGGGASESKAPFSMLPYSSHYEAYVEAVLRDADEETVKPLLDRLVRYMDHGSKTVKDFDTLQQMLSPQVLANKGKDAARILYTEESRELRLATTRLLERIAGHKICTSHMKAHMVHEYRCSNFHYAQALKMLKSCGDTAEAEALFVRISDSPEGKEIGWAHISQTPATFLPGLSSKVWFEADEVPVSRLLTENQGMIAKDMQKLMAHKVGAQRWEEYETLMDNSPDYQHWYLTLYGAKAWDAELCTVVKFTCDLLRPHMNPDLPYMSELSEEISFVIAQPDSEVALQAGEANGRLNVHLGLSNLEGSYIEVADDVQVWSTESSFVVDDAYDRYEATPGQCAPEYCAGNSTAPAGARTTLLVGILHPDIVTDPLEAFMPGKGLGALTGSNRASEMQKLVRRVDAGWKGPGGPAPAPPKSKKKAGRKKAKRAEM